MIFLININYRLSHLENKENDVSNYRPILLVYNFSKNLEKIVKNRPTSYLKTTKTDLISKNQLSFRPDKTKTGTLYETTKFINNELDYKQNVLAIFFGIIKHF
uniref:RNA-directed DNA polymerase n=1 Tax=Schizaphis graminum TaxID=13262 RepID=A0A2S2PRG2_SCHGA